MKLKSFHFILLPAAILLAVAAVIGKFAKDVDPDDTDSVVDTIATIAKARLLLLEEVELRRGPRQ